MIKRLLVIVIAIIFLKTISPAYDTDNIHPRINENATAQSTVDNYLKNQLGFIHGIKEVFKNKEIKEWIKEGGKLEDETNCRSRNHFHDPLKPWDSAGLNNAAINAYCMLAGENYSVDSSLIWSQNPFSDNLWSWTKARNYYYKALTLTTKDERELNYAYTFRALGQVMHLIADSSVPAHVRSDIHVFPLTIPGIGIEAGRQTYESWAKKNFSTLNYTARKVDQSIFNQSIFYSSAPVPIAALWDLNKYNGTNPSITWSPDMSISGFGLTEYTNANFFSEDTIFKDYPHPATENTTAKLVEQRARDGKMDKVWYVRGYTSQRLAAYSYLWNYSNIIPKKEWLYNLDNYVYTDYADQLVPRAVGYSAGLLNYFFRGEIEMIPDDVSGSGYVIVNNTDESMSGIFELWYDNKAGYRVKAWSASLTIDKKSSNNKSRNITFPSPTDIKEPNKYMLVFKGKLGNEEDAVIGRSIEFKDEEYLFFLNTNYEISTFKIAVTNGQYQLTPKSKSVNIDIDFDSFNLTMQSNPAKTEHYAAMPVRYQDFIARYGLYTYGYTDWLGYNHSLSIGSPYCYRPREFTENSPYILGSETATAVKENEDGIFASGRKNYTLDTNGKMTSYWDSIWRKSNPGQDSQYYFRYKDKIGGEWINGSTLPEHITPIAVIGKDKALTISSLSDNVISTTSETLSATLRTVGTIRGECSSGGIETTTITTDSAKEVVAHGLRNSSTFNDELKLGDITVEKCTHSMETISDGHTEFYRTVHWNSVSSTFEGSCPPGSFIWYDVIQSSRDYHDYGVKKGFFPDPECDYCGDMQYTEYEEIGNGESIMQVIDYDNKDEDKTFIVFYMKSVTDDKKWGKISFWGPDFSSPLEQHKDQSYTTEYVMSYRINGLTVSKIKITANNHRITESIIVTAYDSSNNSFIYNNYVPPDDEFNPFGDNPYGSETWSGQRLTGVSCQINDRNMVYTYIIEKWADNKWIFDKRIVGIINISDTTIPIGHRQEFELDFSGITFDPELLSAIGVTR